MAPNAPSVIKQTRSTLRMSAIGRSYTQNFLKFGITEAILSRKLMKTIAVTDGKIFNVYKTFDRKK